MLKAPASANHHPQITDAMERLFFATHVSKLLAISTVFLEFVDPSRMSSARQQYLAWKIRDHAARR